MHKLDEYAGTALNYTGNILKQLFEQDDLAEESKLDQDS